MQRNDWTFDYTAARIAEAAALKVSHHAARLRWWRERKDAVVNLIRSEGIAVDESIVLRAYASPKSRDWEHGAKVMVRNDLQKDLQECLEKLQYHTQQLSEYEGWQAVLEANPESRLALHVDDWLYFFAGAGKSNA